MNGSQIVSEALGEMSSGFFALVSVILMVITVVYLGKAIWIIVRRRS